MLQSLNVKLVKRLIPQSLFNNLFLSFPSLYRTTLVNYESYLGWKARQDLISKLDSVMKLEGNIIECGAARCGTSIIIANHIKKTGVDKKVYALDSFGSGFILDELEAERKLGLTQSKDSDFRYTSYEYVKKKIKTLRLADIIIPMQGLFQNTLPHIKSKYCLAFIDCDLGKSIFYSAETIWPNLSKEGIMLFDDYGSDAFKGVKPAVDDFVNKHKAEILECGLLNTLYYVKKK